MTQPLHPSQLSMYLQMHLRAALASWGLLAIAWALIVSAGFAKTPLLKSSLLGSSFALTLVAKPIRRIAIATERLNDDIQDISQTGFQHWLWEAMKPDATVQQTVDLGDAEIVQELPTYDLAGVKLAHHTIISGPTGAGKSELVKYLVGRYFQGSRIRVYDCDAAPRDWQGLEAIGRQGDFLGISGAMVEDLQLLDRRCELLGRGQEVGGEEVRICEELPTVAAELSELIESDEEERKGRPRRRVSVAANWLKRIARRGRKYRIKLILITQETSVAAMGIEGEGSVRKAFTIFYLGAAALEQAEKLRGKDKALAVALLAYLQRCDRPCLVDHKGRFYVVNIPDLSQVNQQFQSAPASVAPRNGETNIRNQLEMLYSEAPTFMDQNAETVSENSWDTPTNAPNRAKRVREMRAAGLNQTQIIWIEWQVRPGDSQRYRDALQEYRRLVGE